MLGKQFSTRFALALFALLLFTSVALGQITNVTSSTQTPTVGVGHDYTNLLAETVDPSIGSVSLRIAVPVPPGRGLTLPFAWSYNSNAAGLQPSPTAKGTVLWGHSKGLFVSGPWSTSLPQLTAVLQIFQDPNLPPNSVPCLSSAGYMFQDPSDGRHAIGLGMAQQVAAVDFREGSQGTDANAANTHSMAGMTTGRKPHKQTCGEAYQGTQDQIIQDVRAGDLTKALHTIQDAYSPPHYPFKPWNGGYTPFHIPSPGHIYGDFAPSSAQDAAIAASAQFLKDIMQNPNGPIDPRHYLPLNPCGQ